MARWGLVGASNIARQYMIKAINAQPDAEVIGVVSSNQERGAAFAAEQDVPRHYDSLGALLADSDIDCFYISTTNEHHHDQTIAAAKAGKHVLCEKPLALTLADAQEMVAACRKAGVVMATNHHLRNAGLHRRMRDLIEKGAVGEILAVRVFHAVFLPEFLQGWRIDSAAAGGGVVLDITVHDADTVRFVTGDNPTEVTAMTATHGMGKSGLADTAMGVMRMKQGALVQFHDAFTIKHMPTGFEVHGTEGSLVARNCMTQNPVGELYLRRGTEEREIDDFDRDDLYTRSVRNFMAAVNGTGQPSATAEDGLWSLATALAVAESAGSGRVVPVSIA
ncbi:MAG TPA: Gfo/Idh/MocA family oxidoreductase [Thermomicrobiales bacterium]|nr:Gfo/Idh/MocA family oxidoreductase [Thermomicrobiales bacterium]